MVSMQEVLGRMEYWIRRRDRCHFVACTNMHGVTEAYKLPDFRKVLDSADLSLPDGMQMVRIARRRGFPDAERLTAEDLVWAFAKVAEDKGFSNYFYGDTDPVLARMTERLHQRFPRLRIAGTYSPPFRPLTAQEDAQIVAQINDARPDMLWVGMGLPKQERWIFEHRERLRVPVAAAVGATFKFIAGTVKRAPLWMQERGLEWLWRLGHEPRRLWHRVFVYGPQFLLHLYVEEHGLKKYD
jgi:N-acetylglucosaminyldiphosphoundecaprenol N-acetyl-beta-D-mannosaminyltransferase